MSSNSSMMARMEAIPGTNTSTADPGEPTALATCTARLCCRVNSYKVGTNKDEKAGQQQTDSGTELLMPNTSEGKAFGSKCNSKRKQHHSDSWRQNLTREASLSKLNGET